MAPPQSTACSPNKSVSVSSLKVVSITHAFPPPLADAYDNAKFLLLPEGSCSTAINVGTPPPSVYVDLTK